MSRSFTLLASCIALSAFEADAQAIGPNSGSGFSATGTNLTSSGTTVSLAAPLTTPLTMSSTGTVGVPAAGTCVTTGVAAVPTLANNGSCSFSLSSTNGIVISGQGSVEDFELAVGGASGCGLTASAVWTCTGITASGTVTGNALSVTSGPSVLGNSTSQAVSINVGASTGTVHIADGTGSSTIVIGNSTNTGKTQLAGLASSSAAQTGTVCIGASNVLTYDTTTTCLLSDMDLKEYIRRDDIHGLAEVMALRPISYVVKSSANPTLHALGRQVGLGAQEVAKVDPRLVARYPSGPKKGTPSGVRYEQMVAVLIAAIQEQQAEITALSHH